MQNEIVPGVSVIVCCYNSAERLPLTIEHLAKQEVPDSIPWEVIVVDNASTDATSIIAQRLWKKYSQPASFQVIEEKQAGLSFARHTGFTNAKYEYCLFCDDDNWLASNYVSVAYQIMLNDKQIGVLGGIGEGVCKTELPHWIRDNQSSYAIGPQGETEGNVADEKGYVYGAGSVYRRSLYLKWNPYGYTGFLTDRKKNKLISGGDVELCYNYAIRGYTVHYSPQLMFKHYMTEERLTLAYHIRLHEGFMYSRVVLILYRYKLYHEHVLHKRLLWMREVIHAARREYRSMTKLKNTFTYALISRRYTFVRTLKYLRNI